MSVAPVRATRSAFALTGLAADGTERRITCPARWEDDTSQELAAARVIRDLTAVCIGWGVGVGVFILGMWWHATT